MATFRNAVSPANRIARKALAPFLLFLLSFIPRASTLGQYITPDEPIWIHRSLGLRQALLTADWPNTIQSGHPGVTTTWLGAIASQFALWLQPESRENLEWIDRLYWLSPDNGAAMQRLASFLTEARLMVILAASLGIVAVYLLAKERIGPKAAIAAALILAFDPFIAGLGSLLHVDGLLALFMLLTILLLLPKKSGWSARDADWIPVRRRHLILAGVTTALAVLTKTPGLFLVIMVPLIYLWPTSANGPYAKRLLSLLYWAAAVVLTSLILLPALWAAPDKVLNMTNELASRLIETSVRPSFFLGQVTLDPGPAFYPIAVAYRLSPLVMLGLVGLLVWIVNRFLRRRSLAVPQNITWLVIFSLGYILLLNLSAKRFDRYALPAAAALTLAAGWALVFFYDRYLSEKRFRWAAKILFVFILIGYFAIYWPYPLTARNPLLGGPRSAEKILPVGWGEASSKGAKWASTLDDAANRTLFTGNVPSTAPFFAGTTKLISSDTLPFLQPDDLIMFVDSDWQNNPNQFEIESGAEVPLHSRLTGQAPDYASSFNGLSRVGIYSGVSSAEFAGEWLEARDLSLTFDTKLDLLNAAVRSAVWPEKLLIRSEWRSRQPADYQIQLELVDPFGHVWIAKEFPLLNSDDHLSSHWPVGENQLVFQSMTLKPDLPPGEYELRARIFDNQGVGLGIFNEFGDFEGISSPLAVLQIGSPTSQPSLEIPNRLGDDLEAAGFGDLPPEAASGLPLNLDIWWQPRLSTPAQSQLGLLLGSTELTTTIDNQLMTPGITYQIKPEWTIPIDFPVGSYPVSLQLWDSERQPVWAKPVSLGSIVIENPERIFELPNDLDPLMLKLGEVAYLHKAAASISGDFIEVPLIWQSIGTGHDSFVVFVHLRDLASDPPGDIIAQDDRLPRVSSDDWAANQVIIDQHQLAVPGPGRYEIAVGLYHPQTGRRLPMTAEDGSNYLDDQLLFEITVP